MSTFNDVSLKTFQDADAVFAHANKSDMTPFFSVTEADIQPGIVFLSKNPLVDRVKWGKRDIMERKMNGETLWMCTSKDGNLTKYTTTRSLDGDKISLAAYYLPPKGQDESKFTPAKIKYASISSFRARVLSDAEDVACGLSMEIPSLLAVAFGDSVVHKDSELLLKRTWRDVGVGTTSASNNTSRNNTSSLASSPGDVQNSAATHVTSSLSSVPADRFSNAAINRHNDGGTTKTMGGHQGGREDNEDGTTRTGQRTRRNDNGDGTTLTTRQRRRGAFDGDISKRKLEASCDARHAPEKTRKKQKTLDRATSGVEKFVLTSHASTTFDCTTNARHVDFPCGNPVQLPDGRPDTPTSERYPSCHDSQSYHVATLSRVSGSTTTLQDPRNYVQPNQLDETYTHGGISGGHIHRNSARSLAATASFAWTDYNASLNRVEVSGADRSHYAESSGSFSTLGTRQGYGGPAEYGPSEGTDATCHAEPFTTDDISVTHDPNELHSFPYTIHDRLHGDSLAAPAGAGRAKRSADWGLLQNDYPPELEAGDLADNVRTPSSAGTGVTRLTISVDSVVDPAGDQCLPSFNTENYYWQYETTQEGDTEIPVVGAATADGAEVRLYGSLSMDNQTQPQFVDILQTNRLLSHLSSSHEPPARLNLHSTEPYTLGSSLPFSAGDHWLTSSSNTENYHWQYETTREGGTEIPVVGTTSTTAVGAKFSSFFMDDLQAQSHPGPLARLDLSHPHSTNLDTGPSLSFGEGDCCLPSSFNTENYHWQHESTKGDTEISVIGTNSVCNSRDTVLFSETTSMRSP